MKKKSIPLLWVAIVLSISGCATSPMYYWGNYSSTLYHYRKDASDEALNKHMAQLNAIVNVSKERHLRVPPGVYCELGYLNAKQGNNKQALELFILEKTTYPESTHFVDRLAESIKTSETIDKKP
ncbi:MAG: DUF4810 domain-containing protein [Methylophilaceae bacterium]|nr:DUF4810 domain-containing protein [Methylophilaceae bacterium]